MPPTNTYTRTTVRSARVTSLQGFGPAAGDWWIFYAVELDYLDGKPTPAGHLVVHRTDPAYAIAREAGQQGRIVEVVLETRALPHVPTEAHPANLVDGIDLYSVLIAIDGVTVDQAPREQALPLPTIRRMG